MINSHQKQELAKSFKALGDENRLQIVAYLLKQDLSISEIAEHFNISRQGVTKHVNVLSHGGIINIRNVGRERVCSVDRNKMAALQQQLKLWSQPDAKDQSAPSFQEAKTGPVSKNKEEKKVSSLADFLSSQGN
ncbi:MAG: ArsR/SmtB family transcription factor [Luteibaculum sp.]